MSKRCELQKEYYKKLGNYKGVGKYSDDYVRWLESKVLTFKEKLNKDEKISNSLYIKNNWTPLVLGFLTAMMYNTLLHLIESIILKIALISAG